LAAAGFVIVTSLLLHPLVQRLKKVKFDGLGFRNL
jgi:hypothetical protein